MKKIFRETCLQTGANEKGCGLDAVTVHSTGHLCLVLLMMAAHGILNPNRFAPECLKQIEQFASSICCAEFRDKSHCKSWCEEQGVPLRFSCRGALFKGQQRTGQARPDNYHSNRRTVHSVTHKNLQIMLPQQKHGKRLKKTKSKSGLDSKVRIFALLWFVLVAVTSVFLLFMLRTVLTYPTAEEASNRINKMENFVEGMLENNQYLRGEGNQANDGESEGSNTKKIRPEDAVTVAFAVSVTGCGSDPLTEGAAVLKHSIHRASIHGDLGGRYNYKMYAIYHPQAKNCAKTLEALGYELLERDTFVNVKDIEGEFLRKNIEKNGCCGEKEFIKLEAYTLTQHPIVVHLDLDVLVLKPLDSLFDVMMQGEHKSEEEPLDLTQIDIMWPPSGGAPTPPTKVNAFFTRDCKLFLRTAFLLQDTMVLDF